MHVSFFYLQYSKASKKKSVKWCRKYQTVRQKLVNEREIVLVAGQNMSISATKAGKRRSTPCSNSIGRVSATEGLGSLLFLFVCGQAKHKVLAGIYLQLARQRRHFSTSLTNGTSCVDAHPQVHVLQANKVLSLRLKYYYC